MSVESAYDRRRKYIVEHVITGFNTAAEAITFGNTLESIINNKAGQQKFRQYIGSEDTVLAITSQWDGKTILKTTFLELIGNNISQFICKEVKRVTDIYNKEHHTSIKLLKEIIRSKPQPQTIGFGQ